MLILLIIHFLILIKLILELNNSYNIKFILQSTLIITMRSMPSFLITIIKLLLCQLII